MNISGIVKSSLIDYPGYLSCVLFVPGCNYTCYYCHNRNLIDGTHVILSPQYIKSFLEKRIDLLEGVVISGGEPTLQPKLIPFIKMLKELGYKVKLDTNGSFPNVIAEILDLNLCDYYAVDYKAPIALYEEIAGSNDALNVLETINLIRKSNVPLEVRTTVVPQLSKDDLISMANELPKLEKYIYNRYRTPEVFDIKDYTKIQSKPYSLDELELLRAIVKPIQPNLELR